MPTQDSRIDWTKELVDAYCHIGAPKYGALSDVIHFFDRLAIRKGVLALGPGIPDFASAINSIRHFGDSVRVMGIPFGESESQRLELGELQLRAGISGMRVMPGELFDNKALVDILGERGLWLYAINPFDLPESGESTTRYLIEWLDRHQHGRVASPHFLRPGRIEDYTDDAVLFKILLQHPRFHAIFSRQAGTGSAHPYPHKDLLPWVEQIAELVTWDRILWGSEFPIICQRSELPETVRDWLLNLGASVSEQEAYSFYAGNALRLFFAESPPTSETVDLPDWVEQQIDSSQQVYLFPHNQIWLPMEDHAALLSHYMTLSDREPQLDYAAFIARLLSQQADNIRSKGEPT